jgi:oxygen-dependent protoporphyrinogen oxidase
MRRVAVIGGGLSGLTVAYKILEEAAAGGLEVDLTLWEGDPRFGGKIGTVFRDGFRCETGPNGFLDNAPQTLELADRLGLGERLLRSSDAARRRFILTGARLRQLPEKPAAFLLSDLLTLRGRLRIIGEYFVSARKDRDGEDETVASFIRRRLGEEALEKLIDPMTSGIYAGDPEGMSMASCFPRVVALEKQYGGLIRGMIAKQKEARAAGGKGPAGAGPGGTLTSFTDGLQELIDALSSSLGERARASRPTVSVDARGGEEKSSFDVTLEGGDRVPAEAVVIATPAYAAGSILGDLAPEAAGLLRSIPYSAVSVVHFGLDPVTAGHDLNGFGFLIPHSEGRKILGSLWSSSIFPNRAPDGRALVTTMIGGARDPHTPLLDDEALREVVRGELQTAMNQREAPLFSLVTRWEKGIPQYTVGHEERLLKIEKNLSRPGLFLVGNAYRGIGVNDCVKAAQLLAPKVVRYLGSLS